MVRGGEGKELKGGGVGVKPILHYGFTNLALAMKLNTPGETPLFQFPILFEFSVDLDLKASDSKFL